MSIIESIYISPESAAPMESRTTVEVIPGVGISGDRYALGNGTYSARFLYEPGRQLTMVSADAIENAMERHSMMPLSSMGDLRRNLVIRGIGANEMNDMVGREVMVGSEVRLFVHRRTVPCKKSEAQCERPGLVNNLWDDCGVNCEVLTHGTIRVGDTVRTLTTTVDDNRRLRRADPGHKPPAFFVRPSDRTAEQARGMIIPPRVAAWMCLIDPEGFVRVERGYNSVGQRFWSTRAYRAGMFARALRAPLMIAILAFLVAVVLQVKIIWIR